MRLAITEGEKKAVAACDVGIPCVALGGVNSFASKKQNIKLLPELVSAAPKIELEIVFDPEKNEQVEAAQRKFAAAMHDAGCKAICIVELPGLKLDEYLAQFDAPEEALDAFDKLPRRMYTVRDHCEAIRAMPKLRPRVRNQRIYELIRRDLDKHCTGHRVIHGEADALYIFDGRTHTLYPFDSASDGALISRMNELYGVNGSESEWSWLYDELCSFLRRKGRVSQIHEFATANKRGTILYLYAGNQKMFRVSAKGYTVENNGYKGILFRNPGMAAIQPADSADSRAFDFVVETPNFADAGPLDTESMGILLKLWIWGLFFPHLMPTRALLLLYGPKGSFKSSALRRLIQTLFGGEADVSSFDPKKLDALIAILANDYFAVIDNVDGSHPGIENMLAVVATGGVHQERVLYKNGKKFSIRLDAFFAATSRDPKPFRRTDVVDRLLLLTVDRSEQFIGESKIKKDTESNRPKFWRYVLDTLPAVLRAVRKYKPQKVKFRLSDFANFCLSVGPVVGCEIADVEKALTSHEEYKAGFEMETSPLPLAIRDALKTAPIEKMDIAALLKRLQLIAPNFPYKQANSLGQALRYQKDGLRQYDIKVVTTRGRGNRMLYTLTTFSGKKGKK